MFPLMKKIKKNKRNWGGNPYIFHMPAEPKRKGVRSRSLSRARGKLTESVDRVNRTFGNRTQSNSNRSIDFDWVRQSNIIALTQTFYQSNTIEPSKIEQLFNRTQSNSNRSIDLDWVRQSNIILNSWLIKLFPVTFQTGFIQFQTERCGQISFVGFSFKHGYAGKMSVKKTTPDVVVKGYYECSFAVSVGGRYITRKKRGDRGERDKSRIKNGPCLAIKRISPVNIIPGIIKVV